MDFPFSDDTSSKFRSHVSFGSVRSWGRARHSLQITTTWAPSICFFDMMRWNTLSVRLMKNNHAPSPTPPPPPLFSPLGAGDVALMRWYGEKCDLALGSGMFLLRLGVSGTRQGTHERISLSGRKDVPSKSNEDQNTRADLRTRMPHIIQACRATPLLTSLVFFSRSFKVDKVRALISRARYD